MPRARTMALDRKLVASGFTGHAAPSEWLAAEGRAIGRAALKDHGRQIERRIARLRHAGEAAEALCAGLPDEADAVTGAGPRLAQERLFKLMVAGAQGDLVGLCKAARAVAALARLAVLRHLRDEVYGMPAE